jgi:four helix bundle protein
LAVSVYKLTVDGVVARDFGLVDQLRRSAISVPSNIAEGDERDTNRDCVRFLYIAKGSLAELITQLEIAHLVGYFTQS